MGELRGLLCALGAAIAFGVQYVPVKKHEIFDGATFQWFMCSGILFAGFLIAFLSGNFRDGSCCSDLVMVGGALWALSNYFVLPLVKLLGIGLGFSLYHFVNLIVGYAVGRFGLFNVPHLRGNLMVCDFGCSLILASFVVMTFVEVDEGTRKQRGGGADEEAGAAAIPPQRPRADPACQGRAVGLLHHFGSLMLCGCADRWHQSVGGFAFHEEGRRPVGSKLNERLLKPDELNPRFSDSSNPGDVAKLVKHQGVAAGNFMSESTRSSTGSEAESVGSASPSAGALTERTRMRLWGVLLAILGGGLCGVQSVPATLHNEANPGLPPSSVVFPQALGIWVASSLIYLINSIVGKICGWPVPHSVIRPAYVSGCIWCVGFALMIAGISDLGYSVGYTLDAVGPIVVSSLLSLLVFREISGAKQLVLYFVGFTLQIAGVILIASFGQAAS